MKFEHVGVDLGYSDLTANTQKSGRTYATPTGKNYPSITTVLSILSEDGIKAWRARVGEEEANKVSHRAASRGTAVHEIIEKYVNNEEDYQEGYTPNIIQNFQDVKSILDTRIGKVHAQEVALYSDHVGVAGRVDCVAEFDGKLSIIDFKTSRKPKKKEWITSYFAQEAFYAIAWEERTGMPITQLVTIVSVDDEPAQVFVEHRDSWTDLLLDTVDKYKRRQREKELFGR